MKKVIVISTKNLPLRWGWSYYFVVATCLHYWNSPMWLVIGLPILLFLFVVIAKAVQTEIDIFKDLTEEDEEQKKYQSKFQERLSKMAEERGIKKS